MSEIYSPSSPDETPPGFSPGIKSGRAGDDPAKIDRGFAQTFGLYCKVCQRCHKGECDDADR